MIFDIRDSEQLLRVLKVFQKDIVYLSERVSILFGILNKKGRKMVEEFADGIKVGPGNDRVPLYEVDEWFTGSSVDLGTLDAGEEKTLVFNDVVTVRGGARIFPAPLDPLNCPGIVVMGAWISDNQQVSVLIKNISSTQQTYSMQSNWSLLMFNTSAPPTP